MLVGNPYTFSICWETVDEWNLDNTFYNGILYFIISEKKFPPQVFSSTLTSELPMLKSNLINIQSNKSIFSMAKCDAFREMYNITYPEDGSDNFFHHLLSPPSLTDNGYFVFAVKSENNIRILASALEYLIDTHTFTLENIKIYEAIIDDAQLDKITQAIPSVI